MGHGEAPGEPPRHPALAALSPLALRRLGWAALAPVAVAAAWEQWQLLQSLLNRAGVNVIDYRLYRVAATIGASHGWAHIYDPALQRAAIVPLWPRASWPAWWTSAEQFWTPFVSPPPVAWLVAPLNAVPPELAAMAWLGAMAVAIVAAALLIAPGPRALPRYAVPLVLTWATVVSVETGNIAAAVALALVVCWRLSEAGHDTAAGAVLALASLKPQVMFGVPLLLLLTTRRRLQLAWLLGAVALAAASALSLQATGIGDFVKLARIVAALPGEHQLSALSFASAAPLKGAIAAAAVALAAAATWRRRDQGVAIPIAAGVILSLLLSPYLNLEDFVLLIPAALLLLRLRLGPAVDVLAVALVLSATPASQGYVLPEVVVAALLLAALAAGPVSRRRLSPAPSAA